MFQDHLYIFLFVGMLLQKTVDLHPSIKIPVYPVNTDPNAKRLIYTLDFLKLYPLIGQRFPVRYAPVLSLVVFLLWNKKGSYIRQSLTDPKSKIQVRSIPVVFPNALFFLMTFS